MRSLLLILSISVLAGAVGWWAATLSTPADAPGFDPASRPVDPALFERIDRIERELAGLWRQAGSPIPSTSRQVAPTSLPGDREHPSGRAPSPDRFDPRRFLIGYVESFANNPKGSEYFRLAVDAFAPDLLLEISRLVADQNQPDVLRISLVGMLGTPRFAGDLAAIGTLLEAAGSGPLALVRSSLEGLGAIGVPSTVADLQALYPRVALGARVSLLATLTKLAGPQTDGILHQLMLGATDSVSRIELVNALQGSDPDATLATLRHGFGFDPPVRLATAQSLATCYGPAFQRLVEEQLRVETDEAVRTALAAARDRQRTLPPHHPRQATGAPNADLAKDDVRAWAPAAADGGLKWLEVGFPRPQRARGIRIYEGCTAGAVTGVEAYDESGRRHLLWRGDDPTTRPGIFSLPMRPTGFLVRRLRITLDTSRHSGWNEIDAVQLVGETDSVWAVAATASSFYAARRYR